METDPGRSGRRRAGHRRYSCHGRRGRPEQHTAVGTHAPCGGVVVSGDYPHLHSATRPFAEESNESRIRRIRTDRWITYSRAEAALSAMEDLLTFPKRTRMPNLLLVGPTNNGKTMIVEKFRRAHPPIAASATQEGAANVS